MAIKQLGAHVFEVRDGKVVRPEISATRERALGGRRRPVRKRPGRLPPLDRGAECADGLGPHDRVAARVEVQAVARVDAGVRRGRVARIATRIAPWRSATARVDVASAREARVERPGVLVAGRGPTRRCPSARSSARRRRRAAAARRSRRARAPTASRSNVRPQGVVAARGDDRQVRAERERRHELAARAPRRRAGCAGRGSSRSGRGVAARSGSAMRSIHDRLLKPGCGSPTPSAMLSPITARRRHGAPCSSAAQVARTAGFGCPDRRS